MSNQAQGIISFLDVGQGDCTVAVDTDSGAAILIDCPSGRAEQALAHLQEVGARCIELAVVTHSDWDHLGGVYEVLSAFPVVQIRINLDTRMLPDTAETNKVRAAQRALLGLVDRGVRLEPAYAEESGNVGQVGWCLVSPAHHLLLEAQSRRQRNVASVVIRLEIDTVSVLVTGDADAHAWRVLLDGSENLKAEILRLPHHGGRLDVSETSIREVIEAVGASLHIVSVGSQNTYGHPAPEVFAELAAVAPGTRIVCTQLNSFCQGTGKWPLNTALRTLPSDSVRHRREAANECPCGGTVTVQIGEGRFSVMPSTEDHGRFVATLEDPMCRWGMIS